MAAPAALPPAAAPGPASAPPRWISAADLDALLEPLAARGGLVAPVERHGEILFERVRTAAQRCREYVNSLVPPREYFLPARERLLSYAVENGMARIEADPAPAEPLVLFGVRSCDVAGLRQVERLFSGALFDRPDTADPPFMRRRAAITLLSVTCQAPGAYCMCVCCQGGPALRAGYDWQLTELDQGFLVEIASPRGERLAADSAPRLRPATPEQVREKEARVAAVVGGFAARSSRRVQTMAATRMTSTGRLDEAFWRSIGQRCFECGGCAFVCPTCTCFNVADLAAPGAAGVDEFSGGRGAAVPGGPVEAPREGAWERVRLRDCCMLAGFVRQAGGGYPRWTSGERCLTRFFHKLAWQFHERTGALGCTGCGRCVQVCPGGIGIDQVSEEMKLAMVKRKPVRPAEEED